MEKPLVTVYLPTRNRALLVRRALDSVLSQTYPRLEVIVVNDASTDGTAQALARYSTRKNLTVLTRAIPGGACVARNAAINLAKGDLITGIDDDDQFKEFRIAELVDAYRTGSWSAVASCVEEHTDQGVIVRRQNAGIITLKQLLHYNKVGNQVLTATARLRALGGFDPTFPAFQDYDMWVRLVAAFGPILKIKSGSYVVDDPPASERISDSNDRVLRGIRRFSEKHGERFSAAHKQSMRLLHIRLTQQRLSLAEFLQVVNLGNLDAAFALLVKSQPSLSALRRVLKMRYKKDQ